MTLPVQTPYVSYVGNAVATSYPYPWMIAAASELRVYVDEQLTTAYTVTGVGQVGGGTVVFADPVPLNVAIVLHRVTPRSQETDYIDNDPFSAAAHEGALDKLTRMVQELDERMSRSPALPVYTSNALRNLSLPSPGAGKVIGWATAADRLTLYDRVQYTLTGIPLRNVFDPVEQGADPTGVQDSSGALQDTIDLADSLGGGFLWLAGTYSLTQTLVLPRTVGLLGLPPSNRNILGDLDETNVYPARLRWDGVSGGIMLTTADYWPSLINGVCFDGNDLAHVCLYLNGAQRGGRIQQVLCKRTAATGGAGIVLETREDMIWGGSILTFDQVVCTDCADYALLVRGTAHVTFINCEFFSSNNVGVAIVSQPFVEEGVDFGVNDDIQFIGGVIRSGGGAASALLLNHGGLPTNNFLCNFFGVAFLTAAGGTLITAGNNQWYNHFYGCYLYTAEDPAYVINAGGKIHFHDCFFNTGTGHPTGWVLTPTVPDPPATETQFAYTNPGPFTVEVAIWGGTVSMLELQRNGAYGSWGGSPGDGGRSVLLQPGDSVRVTYTVEPAMAVQPH